MPQTIESVMPQTKESFTKEEYEKLRPQAKKLLDDVAEYIIRTESPLFVVGKEKTKQAILRARDKLKEMGF
jgi:ElaB/YqjD/DUF883 family membrane-anchored ribosome-binding protein